MSNGNEDEFQLNFDDETVDMMNLSKKNNGYGAYGNTYNNSYEAPPQHDDIYGVYDPSKDRSVTGTGKYKHSSVAETILNVLHYIALIAGIVCVSYFVVMKKYDVDSYKRIMAMTSLFIEVVFIIEAIVLNHRYRRASLIITGIFVPILYPFFRCSVLGKTKKIPALWLVAYLAVCIIFVKGALADYDLEYGGINKYPAKYESVMKLFKNYKTEGGIKNVVVMNKSFSSYSLDVKVENEDEQYIYVLLEGNAKVYVEGIEKPDSNIPHNVEMTFKVKKSDGSYSAEGLTINKNNHDMNAKQFWSALCSNTNK